MPKLPRNAGPIGLAITAYDVWKRLSPRQRRLLAKQAKKYGPQIASRALESARAAKASLRKR